MIVESKEREKRRDGSRRVPEINKRQAIARKKSCATRNWKRESRGMGEIIRHFVFNAISGGEGGEWEHWPFVELFSLTSRASDRRCLLYGDH